MLVPFSDTLSLAHKHCHLCSSAVLERQQRNTALLLEQQRRQQEEEEGEEGEFGSGAANGNGPEDDGGQPAAPLKQGQQLRQLLVTLSPTLCVAVRDSIARVQRQQQRLMQEVRQGDAAPVQPPQPRQLLQQQEQQKQQQQQQEDGEDLARAEQGEGEPEEARRPTLMVSKRMAEAQALSYVVMEAQACHTWTWRLRRVTHGHRGSGVSHMDVEAKYSCGLQVPLQQVHVGVVCMRPKTPVDQHSSGPRYTSSLPIKAIRTDWLCSLHSACPCQVQGFGSVIEGVHTPMCMIHVIHSRHF